MRDEMRCNARRGASMRPMFQKMQRMPLHCRRYVRTVTLVEEEVLFSVISFF